MKKTQKCRSCVLLANILLFAYCTSNPIDSDDISSGNREIRGKVTLNADSNLKDIFVWLDGVGIGTKTDENGNFNLTLPPPSSQSASGGLDGVFNLYFYVANYGLGKSEVVIQEGLFTYSKGDINKDGELLMPKNLKKIVTIETAINPSTIPVNTARFIGATVTLTAVQDSVTVVFANSQGGLLGAIFLRNIETDEIHIIAGPPTNKDVVDKVLVTRGGHSRVLAFDLVNNPLPIGRYEVIPYVLISHEQIPAGLVSSLGSNLDSLMVNPNNRAFFSAYLKIPFKRDLAILDIGG